MSGLITKIIKHLPELIALIPEMTIIFIGIMFCIGAIIIVHEINFWLGDFEDDNDGHNSTDNK